jgi:hypothetical protein
LISQVERIAQRKTLVTPAGPIETRLERRFVKNVTISTDCTGGLGFVLPLHSRRVVRQRHKTEPIIRSEKH